MEISENLTNWNILDDEDENNDEHRRTYFVPQFCQKWCTLHQKSRWMNQLRQRVQKPGETVDEYEDAIIQLYQRVDPNLRYPMEDRTRQFIIGLRDEIREQVEIACPNTMEEAINKARAVEAAYSKNSTLSSYSLCHTTQGNEELSDIKAVLTQLTQGFQQLVTNQSNNRRNYNNNNNNSNNRRETRTCNNCGRIGHLSRDCRNRNFNNHSNNNNNNRSQYNNNNNNRNNNNAPRCCYICNQFNHIATNCPQRNNNNNHNNNSNNFNNSNNNSNNSNNNNNCNQ